MTLFIQSLISGLLIGAVYGLFSVGLSLTFGVLRVVNFAHGDFVMVGMYLAYSLSLWLHASPYAVLPLVVAAAIPIGVLTYYTCFSGSRAKDNGGHNELIASLGLSLVLENLALAGYGADPRTVTATSSTLHLGAFNFPVNQVISFAVALAATVGLGYVLRVTNLGRGIRALVADREVARLMGIRVGRLFLFAFITSIALAAIAGATLVVQYPVTPTVGSNFILLAFIAVIMGGIGDITGTFIAGLIVGIAETLTATYISLSVQDMFVYGLFIVIALWRPRGILGRAVTT